jgi:hypothetical protein
LESLRRDKGLQRPVARVGVASHAACPGCGANWPPCSLCRSIRQRGRGTYGHAGCHGLASSWAHRGICVAGHTIRQRCSRGSHRLIRDDR